MKQLPLNKSLSGDSEGYLNLSRKTGLFFLYMILFYLFMGNVILPILPEEYLTENVRIIVGQLIIFVPMLTYILVTKGEALKVVPFKKLGGVNVILLVIMTYALMPFISLINAFSMLFAENKLASAMKEMNSNWFIVNLLLMAVIPAVLEELVFRGLIYGGYSKCGKKSAIIFSAFIFGIFHMNINQFMYAFAMGIIFAVIRDVTNTIHATMIMHFVFNGNSVVIMKLQQLLPEIINKTARDIIDEKEMQRINETFEAGSSISLSSMKIEELIPMFLYLIYMAAFGLTIAFIIYRTLKKRCAGEDVEASKRCTGEDAEASKKYAEEDVESRKGQNGNNSILVNIAEDSHIITNNEIKSERGNGTGEEKVLTIPSVIASVICIGLMIYVSLK